MQVMKFSDRCVSGLEHLDEQLRRDQLEILGLDAVRERVHRIAPGPETVARTGAEFAVARHRALEGVAMCVGHSRHDGSGDVRCARRFRSYGQSGDQPLLRNRDCDVTKPAAGGQHRIHLVRGHMVDYTCIGRTVSRIDCRRAMQATAVQS